MGNEMSVFTTRTGTEEDEKETTDSSENTVVSQRQSEEAENTAVLRRQTADNKQEPKDAKDGTTAKEKENWRPTPQIGQKLEAVDKQNPTLICVATIGKILIHIEVLFYH